MSNKTDSINIILATNMLDFIYEKQAITSIYSSGIWNEFKGTECYSNEARQFSPYQLKVLFHNEILKNLQKYLPHISSNIFKFNYFQNKFNSNIEKTLLTNEDFQFDPSTIQVANYYDFQRDKLKSQMISEKSNVDHIDFLMSWFVCTNDERKTGQLLSNLEIRKRMLKLNQIYRQTGRFESPFADASITKQQYTNRVLQKAGSSLSMPLISSLPTITSSQSMPSISSSDPIPSTSGSPLGVTTPSPSLAETHRSQLMKNTREECDLSIIYEHPQQLAEEVQHKSPRHFGSAASRTRRIPSVTSSTLSPMRKSTNRPQLH